MKELVFALVSLLLTLALAACGGGEVNQHVDTNADGTPADASSQAAEGSSNRIETTYRDDGSVLYTDEYDANGNHIRNTEYDEHGSMQNLIKFEYDAYGKRIREIEYDENGLMWHLREHEYNEYGICVKETSYRGDGSLSLIEEFDADSRQTTITYYDYDSAKTHTYILNEMGEHIKTIYYNEDGSIASEEGP